MLQSLLVRSAFRNLRYLVPEEVGRLKSERLPLVRTKCQDPVLHDRNA